MLCKVIFILTNPDALETGHFSGIGCFRRGGLKKSQSLLISRASCRMQMFATNMNYRSYLIQLCDQFLFALVGLVNTNVVSWQRHEVDGEIPIDATLASTITDKYGIYTQSFAKLNPRIIQFCKTNAKHDFFHVIFAAMTNSSQQLRSCPASSQNLASGCGPRCSRYIATLWLPSMSAWLRLDHAPLVERNAADWALERNEPKVSFDSGGFLWKTYVPKTLKICRQIFLNDFGIQFGNLKN